MGLFGRATKHVDNFLEKLMNCPACKHTSEYGVAGCTCKRSDCTCTERNRKK